MTAFLNEDAIIEASRIWDCYYQENTVRAITAGFEDDYVPWTEREPLPDVPPIPAMDFSWELGLTYTDFCANPRITETAWKTLRRKQRMALAALSGMGPQDFYIG